MIIRSFVKCFFAISILVIILQSGAGFAAIETEQGAPSSEDTPNTAPTQTDIGIVEEKIASEPVAQSSSVSGESGLGLGDTFQSLPNATSDPNTGAAKVDIPIIVPPGRKGLQPKLNLTYESNQKNGWIGEGWRLPLDFIQRNTKFGVCYTCNDFTVNGSSELESRGDWGVDYFGAKIEGGFSKYYHNSSTEQGWIVTAKDGTKFYYGTTAASRQDNAFGVFKWMLDRVEDTNGNYISYSYSKDQGEIYLDRIDYTGGVGIATSNYVKFHRDDGTRADAPVIYTSSAAVKTAYRLKTIEVSASGQMVRAYNLTYGQSSVTSMSYLSSVQQYGADAVLDASGTVTGGTALPSMSLTIGSEPNNFSTTERWQNNTAIEETTGQTIYTYPNGGTLPMFTADFNGDGKPDRMWFYGGWNVSLSTGSGFAQPRRWLNATVTVNGQSMNSYNTSAAYLSIGDFNGDGKADYMWFNVGWNVALSTGTGFAAPVRWQDNTAIEETTGQSIYTYPNGSSLPMYTVDFNGDGKVDRMWWYGGWNVSLSTGSGFTQPRRWQNGTAIEETTGQTIYTYPAGSSLPMYTVDFNGDGKIDRMWWYGGWNVSLSTGSGFTQPRRWLNATVTVNGQSMNSYNTDTSKISVGDFNGDGKADYLWNNVGWNMASSDLYPNRVLTSITNSIGSTVSFSYTPSSEYQNTLLPYVLQTVSAIATNDGLGNISTTEFTYSGALHDYTNREFRGFGYVKTTDPVVTTTETWFHQDDIFKGMPYEQIVKDSSGNTYSRVDNAYQSVSPYSGVDFPYLSQKDEYTFDGTPTAKHAAMSFVYDSYGNVTRKYLFGDLDVAGDEKDAYIEYNYDTENWILDRPAHTYVLDNGAVKKSEGWFTYDTKGNLLTETKWLNGGTNPMLAYAYDVYGNKTSITDPRSNTSTITYDSTYHTYPVQVANALGHTVTIAYDTRYGIKTSETDPNGNTTNYEYDIFGRIIKVINPNDGESAYGTESYFYLDFGTPVSQRVVTYKTEQSGTANFIWGETYFDGLGRTVKARREGPDGKVISQDVAYDNRGLKSSESLPYFEGLETPRNRTFDYDPIGRLIQVTNTDGTTVTSNHDKGMTTHIDANGHKKVEHGDVYGNLVKVEEYTGTSGSYSLYASTNYEYDITNSLIQTTDALGNQTVINYDTLGRKTSMTDPDMGVWSYAYDANGNLVSQTDAKGQTIAPSPTTLLTGLRSKTIQQARMLPMSMTRSHGLQMQGACLRLRPMPPVQLNSIMTSSAI